MKTSTQFSTQSQKVFVCFMVGKKRLELLCLSTAEPKSAAYTNFATSPHQSMPSTSHGIKERQHLKDIMTFSQLKKDKNNGSKLS